MMRIKRGLGFSGDAQVIQFPSITLVALIVALGGTYVATEARAPAQSVQPAPLSVVTSDPAQEPVTSLAQPKEDNGPIRVSSGVIAANALRLVPPEYPAEAKEQHVQGVVVLHAIISKTGEIENLSVISGPEMLRQSAIDAVQRWQYKPYLLNGQPVEVQTTVNVNYTFGGDSNSGVPPADSESPPTEDIADAGGAIRVSSGVMAGNVISRVMPEYPADAKAEGVQGAVVLQAVILKTGDVGDLHVVSGPEELTESAITAVKQWKYKPFLLNGEPVDVQTTIKVNFSLDDSVKPDEQSAASYNSSVPLRKIGGGVSAPLVLRQVQPDMTPESKKAQFKGTVLVNLIVDTNGMPQNVHVVRGIGMGLDEKAIEAVKQYKFKPATEGGKPVPVQINIEVNFQVF